MVPRTETAMEHAAWLRGQMQAGTQAIYEINPYTDVDQLVGKLLQIKSPIWARFDQEYNWGKVGVRVTKEAEKAIRVVVANKGSIAILASEIRYVERPDGEKSSLGQGLIEPKTQYEQTISIPSGGQEWELTFRDHRLLMDLGADGDILS
ncbi:MAG: hypothetical protein AAF399_16770 [Bacteroidota bacterium]